MMHAATYLNAIFAFQNSAFSDFGSGGDSLLKKVEKTFLLRDLAGGQEFLAAVPGKMFIPMNLVVVAHNPPVAPAVWVRMRVRHRMGVTWNSLPRPRDGGSQDKVIQFDYADSTIDAANIDGLTVITLRHHYTWLRDRFVGLPVNVSLDIGTGSQSAPNLVLPADYPVTQTWTMFYLEV